MSSGRRSGENILAFASTSLGRRQTTPATFCSADNSSSPSGSLKFAMSAPSNTNGVASHPNNVPAAPSSGEAAVHSGAAIPLMTDPFLSTSCCSSALYRLTHPVEARRLNYEPRANGSRNTGATSGLTALISFARSRERATSWRACVPTLRKAWLASTYRRKAVSRSLASSALVARV